MVVTGHGEVYVEVSTLVVGEKTGTVVVSTGQVTVIVDGLVTVMTVLGSGEGSQHVSQTSGVKKAGRRPQFLPLANTYR